MSDAPVRSPLLSLASMADDRERIEMAIHEAVRSADPYLTEIASHLVVAGGKRLRPVVAIAAAQVGGTPASHDVVRGGVACELVHLGSLYHDDVIDEADTRRSVETVNAKWGNLQAILAGDFLLARASEIAASLGTEVAGLLARTIGRLCEGEIEQLRHAYDIGRPEESYFDVDPGQDGLAVRHRGAHRRHRRRPRPGDDRRAHRVGQAYGMVFQIVDDILDITDTTEQLGKPAGHDLVEGVYTLPVLRTMAIGRRRRRRAGVAARPAAGRAERDKALAIVRANEGVESAAATARRYVGAAEEACADLPPGSATDALRGAAPAPCSTAPSERLTPARRRRARRGQRCRAGQPPTAA